MNLMHPASAPEQLLSGGTLPSMGRDAVELDPDGDPERRRLRAESTT
jgi:hypothetical protein